MSQGKKAGRPKVPVHKRQLLKIARNCVYHDIESSEAWGHDTAQGVFLGILASGILDELKSINKSLKELLKV